MSAGKLRIKVLAVAVVIALALALVVSLLTLPSIPPKMLTRQVNPESQTEQNPLPIFMTALLMHSIDSLIAGNYSATAQGLKTLGVAYIPEKYRFVINRFTQLLNSTSNLLSSVEQLLNESESLIKTGMSNDARVLLNEASLKLASANVTYIELKSACGQLASTFSLPTSNVCGRVDEIGKVIAKLQQRLMGLLDMIEMQNKLEDSFLTIDVAPETVWTGGSILVRGILYTSSGVLDGRTLQLYIDDAKIADAKTNESGQFSIRVSMPYIYRANVTLQAKYFPSGQDSQTYKPSVSNKVEIRLLYIVPKITIEPVGQVLPGRTFTLSGSVEANWTLPYSNVKISWAGSVLNASLVDGRFKASLFTPQTLHDGMYSLTVSVPAWQVYAPANTAINVRVYRLPLNVTLHPPVIVFAGFPSVLKGEISYGAEHFNATVNIVFAGQAYTTNSSGDFSINLLVPLTVFTGHQEYELHVSPALPWYSSADLSGSITVVNPLTPIVPVGLVSALTLRILRGRGTKKANHEELARVREVSHSTASIGHFVPSELEWLIDIYWQAVAIVESMTGLELKPSMTMREYLASTAQRLGTLKASFEFLTAVAEKALYSSAVSSAELEYAKKAFEEFRLAYVKVQS